MNKRKIAYIVITALFCVAILPSAIMNIAQTEVVVTTMAKIGMPLYVLTLIGVWKILGVISLAMPRFRRINEWAYAGFFFDLTGASYVHAAGDDPAGIVPPLVFLGVLAASYFLRPATSPALQAARSPALVPSAG